MNKKKETTTQRKRRLEKAKLKRQKKIANENDVYKQQPLEKNKHENRPARQNTDVKLTVATVAFHPVSDSSGSPLPLHHPTHSVHLSSIRYPIPAQDAAMYGDCSDVASVHERR
ncbi:hypothetical protein EVAR_30333_1 [Eumeta japonica]|uniref:Uncharacterized protein n=1 Tax=Eumeta variegata TaxID=151549 RepID=A0A4C1WAS9_EUMVA|nr:hypothetical protein EVAR_30333_1 [Eumeta japonica]